MRKLTLGRRALHLYTDNQMTAGKCAAVSLQIYNFRRSDANIKTASDVLFQLHMIEDVKTAVHLPYSRHRRITSIKPSRRRNDDASVPTDGHKFFLPGRTLTDDANVVRPCSEKERRLSCRQAGERPPTFPDSTCRCRDSRP